MQLGKRNTRCAVIAVAAFGMSANALAQTSPPSPDPAAPATTPTAAPLPTDPASSPGAVPSALTLPPPAPAAVEPPKVVYPVIAGPFLRLNELFSFRPGLLLQLWATTTQDNTPQANGDSGAFNKSIYMRRARFYFAGGVGKDLTYTILWESSNLGQATIDAANAATGGVDKGYTVPAPGSLVTFGFNDAFFDYRLNPNISVQAGLMLIPFTRNILQSTGTYWSIDIAGVSASYITATQTNTLRDTGIQLKINAADNHFEARAMVSQGVKVADPAGGGRIPGKNDPRVTGFLQYNFLDPDVGYVFNGQYFGKKAIAAIAVGADYQKTGDENAYWATSATAFAAIPIHGADAKNGGDEVGGQIEFLHFHPGRLPVPIATLARQNDLLVELGYYNKKAKMSVFGKFEGRFFTDKRDFVPTMPDIEFDINNTRLYGGGLKYFIAEQLANLTLQYNFTQFPKAIAAINPRNSTSQVLLQLQLAY